MDNSAIGMCMVTPDGRYETVNQALCDFFGLDAETLTRTTWPMLGASPSCRLLRKRMLRLISGVFFKSRKRGLG